MTSLRPPRTAPSGAKPAPSGRTLAAARPEWIANTALAALALLLYARGMILGFVADDFTLLDATLRVPLGDLLTGRYGMLGYHPVSRELYFWLWGRILNLGPGGFHLVNALTFAATAVMLAGFARDLAGPRAGRLAAALLVVFPAGSALLAWVSCAQDLIAMFWSAAALLLYLGRRHALAGIAVALAVLSKETAVVLPVVIAVLDTRLAPRASGNERWRRLAPSALGLAAATILSILARASWATGTTPPIWAPKQITGIWHLPIDLVRTYLPPDMGAGLAQVFAAQPVFPIVLAGLALLAAWPLGPTREPVRPAEDAGPGTRTAMVVGLTLALAAMLPVGLLVEPWRGFSFSLSAIGVSLAAGAWLAHRSPWLARGAVAILALVGFGAGSIYKPVAGRSGPTPHPFVNYAFFRDTGALTTQLLNALEPWCAALRSTPRTFAAGVPPDPTFESVLGPGRRVTCRDTVDRVRFLADFTPADAGAEFGVLHLDAKTLRFSHERADARVRARIGEGFLVHARFDVAAACFAAAAAGHAPDRELSYPLVVSLAANGHAARAESTWHAWSRAGAAPDARVMALRLLGAGGPNPQPEALPSLQPLVAAVLDSPWVARPHRALGQTLLARQRVREAALELSAAAGISREGGDLAVVGQAFEAMGATDEALAAYRRALTIGLPRALYNVTRDRFVALERRTGGVLDPSQTRP